MEHKCQIPFLLLLAGGGEDIGPFFFLLRPLLTSSPVAAGRAMRWLTQVKGNWVHWHECTVVSNPCNSKGNQQQMVLDRHSFIELKRFHQCNYEDSNNIAIHQRLLEATMDY